ncbi:MAG TPA: hypothetical protein VGH28_00005, partial [Polyangiaceae bacterium]
MTLAQLKKKHAAAVRKMDVAAPVDLEYMFRDGLDEVKELTGERIERTEAAGLYVAGSVKARSLTLRGHAIFVEGDVELETLDLNGNMVVMGDLTAKTVVGEVEPFTLTVMGKVTIGDARMKHSFVMQFLGSGTVGRLRDDEGASEELVALWRDAGSTVEVAKIG